MVDTLSDSGETVDPMPTVDNETVIKAQLTENTGAHLLDSGSAYGRHWEENQENPPWEDAVWQVEGSSRDLHDGYVVKNLYHHLLERTRRDERAVALEIALYKFGRSAEYERDSWLTTMEAFAEALADRVSVGEWVETYGVPVEVANRLPIGLKEEVEHPYFTFNTYNTEFHDLTQVIQGVGFGGPYANYTAVSVHGGCDIRGGYTAPRVYEVPPSEVMGSEFHFRCESFDWRDAESCCWDNENLIFLDDVDPFALEDAGYIDEGEEEHPALEAAHQANHDGRMDGAVFYYDEQRDDIGHVTFS